jgi:hypothetical protein
MFYAFAFCFIENYNIRNENCIVFGSDGECFNPDDPEIYSSWN